jgi:hypothetical protein
LLIAFPNADDPPSGNHESLESKIPKRKKARPNTRLSCKIEYFIETTSAYLSGRSAFFTDDCVPSRGMRSKQPVKVTQWQSKQTTILAAGKPRVSLLVQLFQIGQPVHR